MKIRKTIIKNNFDLPFADDRLKAVFSSPAQDYIKDDIDLNKLLIKHLNATSYATVDRNSMQDAGIENGDILIIDRSFN